jgi:hypothetical protein
MAMTATPENQHATIAAFAAKLPLRRDAQCVRHRLAEAFAAHVEDLWPAGDAAATPEWIAANVDGMVATLERLYALAAEDEHPGVGTFLYRMSWLPTLLADIERGTRLDG